MKDIDFEFNEGQKDAIHLAKKFLELSSEEFDNYYNNYPSPNKTGTVKKKDWFCIRGAGGTGKTSVADAILDDGGESFGPFRVAATLSHQAKEVLASKLDENINCTTLAKLIGMKPGLNDYGGTYFYLPKNKPFDHPYITTADIILVDEASMLSDRINGYMDANRKEGSKVLCLLDKHQLKPIDQEEKSATVNFTGVDLTKIERYQGAVADICNDCRTFMDNSDWNFDFYKDHINNNDISLLSSKNNFIHTAVDLIKGNSHNNFKAVSYRNKSVSMINQAIRRELQYKEDFVVGDWITINDMYSPINYEKRTLNNGLTFIVEQVKKEKIFLNQFGLGDEVLPIWKINFTYYDREHGEMHPVIYVVAKEAELAYKKHFDKLLRIAKAKKKHHWANFYAFKNHFAKVEYAYCQTAYKVQGQSISNVIVNLNDIKSVGPITDETKFESIYVGMSRTIDNLMLYDG